MRRNQDAKELARRLMLKSHEDRGTAIIYYCHCGQRIILTIGEASRFQQRAREAGVKVIDSYDYARCPKCGKPLGRVWESLAWFSIHSRAKETE